MRKICCICPCGSRAVMIWMPIVADYVHRTMLIAASRQIMILVTLVSCTQQWVHRSPLAAPVTTSKSFSYSIIGCIQSQKVQEQNSRKECNKSIVTTSEQNHKGETSLKLLDWAAHPVTSGLELLFILFLFSFFFFCYTNAIQIETMLLLSNCSISWWQQHINMSISAWEPVMHWAE